MNIEELILYYILLRNSFPRKFTGQLVNSWLIECETVNSTRCNSCHFYRCSTRIYSWSSFICSVHKQRRKMGCLPAGRLVVQSLATPVCMLKYPWARYRTVNCPRCTNRSVCVCAQILDKVLRYRKKAHVWMDVSVWFKKSFWRKLN